MRDRIVNMLLVVVVVAAQAAPLAATAPTCRMQPSRAPSSCGSCGVDPSASVLPSVSASSCCKFEAAQATSALPGIVPTLLQESGLGGAIPAMTSDITGTATPALANPFATTSHRSTGVSYFHTVALRL